MGKRYQRGNQKPSIEEGQTTQWVKEKGQKDNNALQNIHIKLKVKQQKPPLKSWVNSCENVNNIVKNVNI